MCKELKRLQSLSECAHLNKTDRDAIKWVLDQVGESKQSTVMAVSENKKYSLDDYGCAEWMFELIKQLNPNHKQPNLESWAEDIRKMVNIDNRTYDEISNLMMWVNKDSFWSINVLSPKKLRDKWDQLIIKSKAIPTGSSNQRANIDFDDTSWANDLNLEE